MWYRVLAKHFDYILIYFNISIQGRVISLVLNSYNDIYNDYYLKVSLIIFLGHFFGGKNDKSLWVSCNSFGEPISHSLT